MVHLDLNTGGQAEGLVVPTVGRGCVQAKYDFTGRAADELTFKKLGITMPLSEAYLCHREARADQEGSWIRAFSSNAEGSGLFIE